MLKGNKKRPKHMQESQNEAFIVFVIAVAKSALAKIIASIAVMLIEKLFF